MRTKELTLIAVLVSILVVSQFALSIVVGLNLVFPLLIIYTYNLGLKKGLIITYIFILVRFLLGLPILVVVLWGWTFTILVVLAYLVSVVTRKNEYVAALYTFLYFILFGFLCGVQEYFLTEVPIYVYWLRGVPTDLLGATAGFVTTVILMSPLTNVIKYFNESLELNRATSLK